jgi:hypothetical protein
MVLVVGHTLVDPVVVAHILVVAHPHILVVVHPLVVAGTAVVAGMVVVAGTAESSSADPGGMARGGAGRIHIRTVIHTPITTRTGIPITIRTEMTNQRTMGHRCTFNNSCSRRLKNGYRDTGTTARAPRHTTRPFRSAPRVG